MIYNEIIPTLFALDKMTFERKLKLLSFSRKIHIDFMDGKFVSSKSVEIENMKSILDLNDVEFQIHLMVYNPEEYVEKIKSLGITKVLIQEEVFKTSQDIKRAIDVFKKNDFELFIVLNPSTKIDRIKSFLEIIDGIMVMSVWPGLEGQKFIEDTYDKIKEIRDFVGEGFPIQVDGGVKD
jgi:ribulose-phosphate 3-epimerase